MKTDIVICSKCNGSGKFIYKSGMTGPCYQCNGKGSVKRIPHKSFQISIVDNDGVRIDWLNVNAGSENAAVSKARVIAARGCYKDQIDSIKAVENGIDYLRSASVFPSSSTIFVTSAAIFSASSFVTLPVMFPAAS